MTEVPHYSRRATLFAVFFLAGSYPTRAHVLVSPADQYFSAEFPKQPDEKTSEKLGLVQTIYTSAEANKILLLSRSLWPVKADPLTEMQSMLDGFMERLTSELLSIQKVDFVSAVGKKLPGKRFTFGNPKVWGEGIVIVSGRHSYVVVVATRKPIEELDAAGKKFISSFKVLD